MNIFIKINCKLGIFLNYLVVEANLPELEDIFAWEEEQRKQ